jgi:hypothetical protein
MSEQAPLPGTAPNETRVTGAKLTDLLLQTGVQIGLDKLCADLRFAQKQHPAAVGLTLAIALAERDKAEATLKTLVQQLPQTSPRPLPLAAAAKAGIDFEGRLLTSGLEGDVLVVRAVDEPPAA